MRYNQNRMWKNTGSSFAQQVTLSASAVHPPPSLHAKTQHRWMQCFSVGCGRDGRLLWMLFLSFHRLCDGADFTSGVVVEETVVCAGFRVCVPERRSTETKRRELYLPLGESLLQLSLQSLDEPPKERTHRHRWKTPQHLTELFMLCTVCWVDDKVQKSLRQDRRGKQKAQGYFKATLHRLSLSPASSSAALRPSPPPPASTSPAPDAFCPAASFLQPAADASPTSSLPADEAVPSLLWCFR